MPDINGAASKPPQISVMFQKFALAFKAKTFESFADDNEEPPAARGDSSDAFALLDSTEEVITGQRVVVIKPDHCRAAPVAVQSWLPEPNLSPAETLGREQRACGLSPESTRLAKDPWREKSSASGKMNSGERERGRDASSLGRNDTTCRHVSISEWFTLIVIWKSRPTQYFLDKMAFQPFSLKSHFDFLLGSDLQEKLKAKKDSLAAFVAPVVLSMIAYEYLHRKKASKCEVFLSFSGEDAVKNFADSLYEGMVDAGIFVFRNDCWLRRHEEIGLQAIKSSKISIPILSSKYASSGQCLDELVQIMKCKNDSSGHVVLPIFYRVKSADFRCKIDVCGQKVVEERQRALTEISSLRGWKSDKILDTDGGQLVKLVVQKVLIELKKALELFIAENPVGIQSPVKEIMEFVDDSRASTLYVVIHGEGGVGKTTLAKVIYNKLSYRFDHFSFIPNVRESCKCKGIEYLQNQLISDILKTKKKVYDKEGGIAFISSEFKGKRVLIFLDDVDANHQLEALVGDRNWFAPGSRIIITTRDKSALDWAKVDYEHKHKEMDEDEAKILFARHAFRRESPPIEFLNVSNYVVSTIRRFPIALEVIGSYFCGKSLSSWPDPTKNSKELPQMGVQEILKIVYEALEIEQRKIFLDIACFLVGSDARIASYMWDASESHLVLAIEELRFMSLIKIGDNRELRMHDELRDLGRSIVREGYGNQLDRGSRLWEYEEALKVLRDKTGTDNIRALSLSKNSLNPCQNYTYEQFKNLVGLRFLYVSDASFHGDFKNKFSKLRWFQWERCPEILEAKNFGVKELAILDLSGSMIRDAWKGWNSITSANKLKVLNLTGCSSLESTFFLSDFESLEILILRNCDGLVNIHRSIGDLKNLVSIDLSGCSRLEKLPNELGKLEELKELLLDRTNIQEIPSFIGSLKKLEMMSAKECEFLARFLDSIFHPVISSTTVSSESPLSDSMGSLVKLQCLSLQSCGQLRLIPDSIGKLKSLAQLVLAKTKITGLPESIENLQNLEILNISSTDIEKLPNAIGRLRKLRELDASKCGNLIWVISSIHDLSSLQHLNLIGCHKLQSLPMLPCNLIVVGVTCKSIKLPSFSHLIHLKQLRLHYCGSLECIPELPSTLLELEVLGCEKLQFLTPLESLERLDIIRCKSVGELDLSEFNHLRVLNARNCRNIQEIRGLDRLNDLKSLTIQGHPPIELDPFLPVRNGHDALKGWTF